MTPEEIVQGQLDAYNAHDLDRLIDYYVDAVPVFAFPSGESLVTPPSPPLREIYRSQFESNPDLRAELVSRVVNGRIVIDKERVTGLPGGQTAEAVAIYEVGAEKIERVWFVV